MRHELKYWPMRDLKVALTSANYNIEDHVKIKAEYDFRTIAQSAVVNDGLEAIRIHNLT